MKKVKRCLKKILNIMGFEIYRIPQQVDDSEIVTACVGSYNIQLFRSHRLPDILKKYPSYSMNLPRLVVKAITKYPQLRLVDVGANAGDTVALVRTMSNCPIYCVEGDDRYYRLLQGNMRQFDEVYLYNMYLGEVTGQVRSKTHAENGTLRLVNDVNKTVHVSTLDNFIEREMIISAKVLKIDTDGYDFKILKGATKYLQNIKPLIFLEYDSVFLEDQNDSGLDLFSYLQNHGYRAALFYDNYGRFLVSTEGLDSMLVRQLHGYIHKHKGAFQYYDICLFHEVDLDLFQNFREEEMLLQNVD